MSGCHVLCPFTRMLRQYVSQECTNTHPGACPPAGSSKLGGMHQDECVHSLNFVRSVVSACGAGGHVGGYISVPTTDRTQIWWVRTLGPAPGLLDSWPSELSLTTVRAFLLLSPTPMSGPDTRASSKLKIGSTAIDATESHQNWQQILSLACMLNRTD